MPDPIANGSMSWLCRCGFTSWMHHENCDRCGVPRPAPEPDTEPSHTAMTEPASFAEFIWCLDRQRQRLSRQFERDITTIAARRLLADSNCEDFGDLVSDIKAAARAT